MRLYRNIRREEKEEGRVSPRRFPGSEDSSCPEGTVCSFWLRSRVRFPFGILVEAEVPDEALIGEGRMEFGGPLNEWYEAFEQDAPWWACEADSLEEVYVSQDITSFKEVEPRHAVSPATGAEGEEALRRLKKGESVTGYFALNCHGDEEIRERILRELGR